MVFRVAGTGAAAISSYQGYYGNFYSDTTQTDGGVSGTPMEFEHTVEGAGVSVVADGSGKYNRLTFANAGVYNIQFSAQLHNQGGGGAGTTVNIWLRYNGNVVANTDTKVTVNTNSPFVVAAWNFIQTVAANGYVELIWLSDNANIKIEATAASSPAPAIPATIITAVQVR